MVADLVDYSSDALCEADAFLRHRGKVIMPLTEWKILEKEIELKLV